MSPQERERRGNEANFILQHEIYKEAYASIRERLVSQLELADCPAERRKRCNDLLIALRQVQRYMQTVMETGAIAAQEIEAQTRAEKLTARVRSAFVR